MKSSPNEIYLNRLHWPVTTLGYGKRVGIWFQGCSIGCKGCCAKDTWDRGPEHLTSIDTVLAWIDTLPTEEIDGFTITGGEPFEQAEALKSLIRVLRRGFGENRDILVYTGYSDEKTRRDHSELLDEIDLLISGPYVDSRPRAVLRGSDNQKMNLLSRLSKRRYSSDYQNASVEAGRVLQFSFDGNELLMIGIPSSEDLLCLESRLAECGVSFDTLSWK